ncbi:hypothetical protein HPB52_023260 [Rhipicephalus sanguineus]|uniref:Uncharacterized protein n=1 Tax=Rhipicephalus sanguineus TaxID=34632 RepID=A0A9D4Q8U1_RHISA|nr:hypothetical protein HPB52_023260 [Rhipicephalus sanguineus]
MVVRSLKVFGISVVSDGCEHGHLPNRLAGIGDPVVCQSRASVSDECVGLLFCTDSEELFAEFSDDG